MIRGGSYGILSPDMRDIPRLLFVGGLAIAVVLVCGVTACSAPSDPVWERLRESRTLRVGMDASFPPFESIGPDGSPVGLDVDLAREVAKRSSLRPQFVANLPYDGLYDALAAQRVDVVISALVIDPSRTEDYAYSIPYFNAGPVLVSSAGRQAAASVRELDGHRLSVALGTEGDRMARQWERRLTDLTVLQHRTVAEALRAVERGRSDVALVDHVSALEATAKSSDLVIVGEPVADIPYACAVRHDSVHLLEAINQALKSMEEDGTMEELISKWLE